MVSFEELKDAKITELLADYIELEKKIDLIPERLSGKIDEVKKSILSIPLVIEESINKIADSTEKAEVTAEKLKAETQAALAALSQSELNQAKEKIGDLIKSSMDEAVKKSLSGAKKEIQVLEERVRAATASAMKHNPAIMNYVLALVMTVMIVTMLFSTVYLWGEVQQARDWARKAERTLDIGASAMDKLPEKYKQQIRDAIEKQ